MTVALAGCGAEPVTPSTGHVDGNIFMQGGGGIVEPTPVEADVIATPTTGDTSRTFSTKSAKDGSFVFDLSPGTYELSATMLAPNQGDQATPVTITVVAGATVRVKLSFNYPAPGAPQPTGSPT